MHDLLGWFLGRSNRRSFERKSHIFVGRFSVDGGKSWAPVFIVDLSHGGVGLVFNKEVKDKEYTIQFRVGERIVSSRMSSVWSKEFLNKGQPAWRVGSKFIGIAADDWDAIVRFMAKGTTVEPNVAKQEIEKARMTPDDANRLLPKAIQDKMLAELVMRRRLAPLDDRHPLVQYFYSGPTRRNDKMLHKITIESRVNDPTSQQEKYETIYYVDETTGSYEMELVPPSGGSASQPT